MCYKDGRKRVGMLAKDFPNYGIWSVKDAPFVCIESWYGRCDSINYKGEWKKRKWGNRFEAGKTFKGGYDIEAF